MKLNLELMASRFKQARVTLEYSLEEVSRSTGISIDEILSVEQGKVIPSGDDVLILAEFYDCDFRGFIDSACLPPVQKAEMLFRRYGDAFSANDRRSVQEFLNLCRIESQLQGLLDCRVVMPGFKWSGSYYKNHGEQLAMQVRGIHGYSENEVPRDIYRDFRSLGVHIFRRNLENKDISGLYVNDPVAGHCVLVNYDEDVYRQRFSVSHEVAHAIFDSSEESIVSFDSNSTKYDRKDLIEIRANSFASHYLIPVSMLKKLGYIDRDSALYWAQEFRVSTSALAKALKDAKLITEEQARSVRSVRVSRDSKIDPEAPDYLSEKQREQRVYFLKRGLSNYYVKLCFEAFDKELISAARLAEVMKVDIQEMAVVGSLFGRRVRNGI